MSYDIFVFDPKAAPTGHAEFMDWFTAETEASDSIEDFTDPKIASQQLQGWFSQISRTFPALNGPTAPAGVKDMDEIGDYTFRPHSVYISFGWSLAQKAAQEVFETAQAHRLGLFDLSSATRDVYLPDGNRLKIAHSSKSKDGLLTKLGGLFKRT
ncbi:replication restart DNA helicase PriA [Granulicella rosea]|uniref:Replication restart DNA helicase PriA n=1 Tax=Granulicella rosea TaxID=474952 RepID=A0A239KXW2_9BACT|nr:hypothetical protein [Granulicella rosea]SNT22488.1 replication restart DNA helicase PriA [Granulicella rosea]